MNTPPAEATIPAQRQPQETTPLYLDTLTQLPLRDTLVSRIKDMVANGQGFDFLLIDARNLKHANDTHGYAAGDGMLKEIAERLQMATQKEDGKESTEPNVIRIGGDEFVVLIPHDTEETDPFAAFMRARSAAADKKAAVNEPGPITIVDKHGKPQDIDVIVVNGVASYTPEKYPGADPETVLKGLLNVANEGLKHDKITDEERQFTSKPGLEQAGILVAFLALHLSGASPRQAATTMETLAPELPRIIKDITEGVPGTEGLREQLRLLLGATVLGTGIDPEETFAAMQAQLAAEAVVVRGNTAHTIPKQRSASD
ncbi:GGDEF domain-containing protein [Candidatus Saccharibacteria bacterium]|nr:GGDEF domain-containing protein [Candidatus Saccharibacteria bacterium]